MSGVPISQRDLLEYIASLANLNVRAITTIVISLVNDGAINASRGVEILREIAGMSGDVPVNNPLIADLWGDSLAAAADVVEQNFREQD